MTGLNPSRVRYRQRRLLVDDQLKNIWSGIVTHYVKVEFASSDFGQIEVSKQYTFLSIEGTSQNLAQRRDDGASTPTNDIWLVGEFIKSFQILWVHVFRHKLITAQDKAAPLTGDMA